MVKPQSSTKRLTPPVQPAVADQETRERILDAADRVFVRKGTANSRTQEIADEAGVNKALVHYYFGTKAALADAIFARALALLVPRIFGILADPGRSIDQKVPAIVKEQIDFHSARPYVAGYLVAELHAHPDRIARLMRGHGKVPLDVLRRQLQEGARAGRLRRISPEQFVANMMGLLIFPFAIRPALCELLDLDADRWRAFLDERRRILPDFVMAGLRP
ncbi:MAG TPA: TetR/AcrR family transcriptional regulator [Gemmatimonadales bacterium]|nr:TetR/AcrR family transcriptional regulator [Gemmatimonadales bacterium]